MKKTLTLLFLNLMLTLIASAQCTVNGVYIKAYLVDPNTGGSGNSFDTDNNGTVAADDEFVQICNSTGSNISLSGYTLADIVGVKYTFTTGDQILAGQCLVISTRWNTTLPSYVRNINTGPFWNNTSDNIILSDGTNTCTVSYTSTNWSSGCVSVVGSGSGTPDCSITPSDLGTSPLPVELTNFSAKQLENNVQLNWSTASELNNDYFEIQKSLNGIDFFPIAEVQGAGNSNDIVEYQYTDENVFENSFYRLKQVDFDNEFEYSEVIYVSVNQSVVDVVNNETGISIHAPLAESTEYLLLTSSGLVIEKGRFEKPEHTINANLVSGIYFLTIYADGKLHQQRIVR